LSFFGLLPIAMLRILLLPLFVSLVAAQFPVTSVCQEAIDEAKKTYKDVCISAGRSIADTSLNNKSRTMFFSDACIELLQDGCHLIRPRCQAEPWKGNTRRKGVNSYGPWTPERAKADLGFLESEQTYQSAYCATSTDNQTCGLLMAGDREKLAKPNTIPCSCYRQVQNSYMYVSYKEIAQLVAPITFENIDTCLKDDDMGPRSGLISIGGSLGVASSMSASLVSIVSALVLFFML
jgi:hypothetical protein